MMVAVFSPECSGSAEPTRPPAATLHAKKKRAVSVPQTHTGSTGRTSKLHKLGAVLRTRLLQSRLLRGDQRISKATAEVLAAIKETSEGPMNDNLNRSCQDAVRKMEDILFSVGGAERIVATLRYFKDRSAMHKVARVRDTVADDNAVDNHKFFSKGEKLSAIVMDSLKDFFEMFDRQRGGKDKGGGRRTLESQNVYDAVMTSLVSEKLDAAKLGRMLSEILNVTHKQIKRGRSFGRI